jgi:hypothetical protein
VKYEAEIVIQAELFIEMHHWLEGFLKEAGVPLGQRDRLFELDQGELQAVLRTFQAFSYNIKEDAEYKGYALNDFDPNE